MRKKVVSFPVGPSKNCAQPITEERSRVIFTIGGERFAVDFSGSVTEIKPDDAQVVPIKQRNPKQTRKRRSRGSRAD